MHPADNANAACRTFSRSSRAAPLFLALVFAHGLFRRLFGTKRSDTVRIEYQMAKENRIPQPTDLPSATSTWLRKEIKHISMTTLTAAAAAALISSSPLPVEADPSANSPPRFCFSFGGKNKERPLSKASKLSLVTRLDNSELGLARGTSPAPLSALRLPDGGDRRWPDGRARRL